MHGVGDPLDKILEFHFSWLSVLHNDGNFDTLELVTHLSGSHAGCGIIGVVLGFRRCSFDENLLIYDR